MTLNYSEESNIKFVAIVSVVSEAKSYLQQFSFSAGLSPSRAQKEGEREIELEIPTQRNAGKNRVSDKRGFSSHGASLEHKVIHVAGEKSLIPIKFM